jgi:hypothetical protein
MPFESATLIFCFVNNNQLKVKENIMNTENVVMTKSQLVGMIKFATKCEKAYRSCGKVKDAESAKKHREMLEKEYNARFSGM